MVYKVCITGTESTGKSTLAEKLSIFYKTLHVSDYSRYYIDQLNRPYNKPDVLEIAHGIIELEDRMMPQANGLFFTDNDLVNIKIWLQYYDWDVPDWLNEQIVKRRSDLYLLCDIDLPWIADEQRSNPNDRALLFERFKTEMAAIKANYQIVTGLTPHQRLAKAVAYVDKLNQTQAG
ncbi:MAG TPA: ATP-binding protein [Chitinophagales bacterium]|nr:ATP-binding protein [Chitinophagales bacterium]